MFFEDYKSFYKFAKNNMHLIKTDSIKFYGNRISEIVSEKLICKNIYITYKTIFFILENKDIIKLHEPGEAVLEESGLSIVNVKAVHYEYNFNKKNIKSIQYRYIDNGVYKTSEYADGTVITNKVNSNGIAFEIR